MVATSVAAGWAFAIYRFKGRDQLFLVLVATMFVPPIATLVPLYWLVQTAGLQDTLIGVLLPQLANASGIFLIRQFARGVPVELLDAARVDGASSGGSRSRSASSSPAIEFCISHYVFLRL